VAIVIEARFGVHYDHDLGGSRKSWGASRNADIERVPRFGPKPISRAKCEFWGQVDILTD